LNVLKRKLVYDESAKYNVCGCAGVV